MPKFKRRPQTRKEIEKTLSVRQNRYVQEYIQNGGDALKAAVAAGYPEKSSSTTVSRLMKDEIVQKALSNYQNIITRAASLTFERKISKLSRIIDEYVNEDGEIEPKKATVAIAAISEANKMQGHYAAEKSVNINANLNTDVDVIKMKQIADELIKSKEKPY